MMDTFSLHVFEVQVQHGYQNIFCDSSFGRQVDTNRRRCLPKAISIGQASTQGYKTAAPSAIVPQTLIQFQFFKVSIS